MEAYEYTIARLMDHIEDGVVVLSLVQDQASARRAAGMFVEASDRLALLRLQMLQANPRDKIPVRLVVLYGPRYFLARLETERQLNRIKGLDEATHQPLKDVLHRLDDRIKQIEDGFEQATNRGARN